MPAVGIEVSGGRVHRVVTKTGSIDTPTVVIAGGPWSGQIGAMAGIDLPIQPIRRQIAVTGPIPGLRPDFPFVIDFSRSLYFHREGNGILTGMSNRGIAQRHHGARNEHFFILIFHKYFMETSKQS